MCDRDNDFFYGASWCVVAWLPVPWCRPTAKPPAQWRHQTAFVPPAPMTQKRQKQRNSTDKFAWRWAACRTRETTFLLLIWSLRELDARLPKSLFFSPRAIAFWWHAIRENCLSPGGRRATESDEGARSSLASSTGTNCPLFDASILQPSATVRSQCRQDEQRCTEAARKHKKSDTRSRTDLLQIISCVVLCPLFFYASRRSVRDGLAFVAHFVDMASVTIKFCRP